MTNEARSFRLGVCYYPEQWPEAMWADDAARMASLGIRVVRIGEFAWSRIEPEPGRFDWGWYDRAIAVLADAGLSLVLGTPTATPPKWLVDAHPDILACDADGRPRRFGSRRHYCFSSPTYRREAARITRAVAQRYGTHPAVIGWQTDNEYGCHDTVLSYSDAAARGFRDWLADRYGTVSRLNDAWGNMFWSQDYPDFASIDPPNLTVTEAHPAHRLAWQRFSSDQVVAFNRMQCEILRAASPGRDIVHNFMGFFTGFDHHAVAESLDVAAWDSYPLGFLDQGWDAPETKARYLRQGHPDFAAFHHDLYRGCGRGRMWVLEQQPGPVNWAPHNPAPLPGMVRLWSWEAAAHGAELVSYFRWRQAPFAQEQMHAGLLRPDDAPAPAFAEVAAVAREAAALPTPAPTRARVALLFDYRSIWMHDIQPQGRGFRALELIFAFYSGLRRRGLDVDILPPDAALEGYALVVAPTLAVVDAAQAARLSECGAQVLLGPRTASRTADFRIPDGLPMSVFGDALPLRVARVESLPRDHREPAAGGGAILRWLEEIEGDAPAVDWLARGPGIVFRAGRLSYLAGWPDAALLDRVLSELAGAAGLATVALPAGLRLRRRGGLCFAFNYAPEPIVLRDAIAGFDPAALVLGSAELPPAGVAAWRN